MLRAKASENLFRGLVRGPCFEWCEKREEDRSAYLTERELLYRSRGGGHDGRNFCSGIKSQQPRTKQKLKQTNNAGARAANPCSDASPVWTRPGFKLTTKTYSLLDLLTLGFRHQRQVQNLNIGQNSYHFLFYNKRAFKRMMPIYQFKFVVQFLYFFYWFLIWGDKVDNVCFTSV